MQKHPPELKNKIIGRMMPPTNESIRTLSRETGISEPTLHQWRTQARKNGFAAPADGKESDRWSPQDKFLIVMQTYPMNETELAEYCRSKGLYAEQIEAWRDACLLVLIDHLLGVLRLREAVKRHRHRGRLQLRRHLHAQLLEQLDAFLVGQQGAAGCGRCESH